MIKPLLQKIFFVKYNKNYKIMTIFGIKISIKIKNIFPLKRMKFEDIEVNVPNNPIAFLDEIISYGDIIKLPKYSKTNIHNISLKIRDKGYADFINTINIKTKENLERLTSHLKETKAAQVGEYVHNNEICEK